MNQLNLYWLPQTEDALSDHFHTALSGSHFNALGAAGDDYSLAFKKRSKE
jgi:hypothetical protein